MSEMSFLLSLQALHGTFFDSIMMAATRVGNAGEIWIALAAVLLCSKKTRPVSIAIIVSLFADLFARPRPCAIETGVSMLQACPPSFSFPSGHTAVSFTVLGVLLASREFKIALAALPVALLIAFSRLWLFAHFPTDVLGGVAVGLVIGYGTWHLLLLIPAFKRLWNRSNREEALTQA